jgi:hypothetical protein
MNLSFLFIDHLSSLLTNHARLLSKGNLDVCVCVCVCVAMSLLLFDWESRATTRPLAARIRRRRRFDHRLGHDRLSRHQPEHEQEFFSVSSTRPCLADVDDHDHDGSMTPRRQ